MQVADRFHLLQNLKQMLDRLLTNQYKQIRPLLTKAGSQTGPLATTHSLASIRDVSADDKTASAASRERRLELYQQVKQLQAAGWKIRQIARRLDLNHTTIRKFFYAEAFLERTRRPAGGSILEPYLTYMEERFREGLRNGLQLWREIKQRGYPGTNRQVSKWISKRRQQEQAREGYKDLTISTGSSVVPAPPTVEKVPSARQWT